MQSCSTFVLIAQGLPSPLDRAETCCQIPEIRNLNFKRLSLINELVSGQNTLVKH